MARPAPLGVQSVEDNALPYINDRRRAVFRSAHPVHDDACEQSDQENGEQRDADDGSPADRLLEHAAATRAVEYAVRVAEVGRERDEIERQHEADQQQRGGHPPANPAVVGVDERKDTGQADSNREQGKCEFPHAATP